MTEPTKKRAAVQAPPLLPHPLFEPEEPGEEPAIVYRIKVTRWGARGQRWVPQQFDASALVSLEQIQQTYGGGDYELIAYGPGGCVARRRYSLDGRPKPLYPDEEDDGEGFATGAPPAVAAPPVAAAPHGSDSLLALILQTTAQTQSAMMTGLMSLVGAMISGSSASAERQVATMQELHSQHAAAQANFLAAIVQAKSGGGGNTAAQAVELLREGIAIGKTTAGTDGESDEIGGLIEAAAPFIMGAMQAQQPANDNARPPPPAPEEDEGEP